MKLQKSNLLAAALAGAALALAPTAVVQATVLSSFLTFDGPQCTATAIPLQCGGEDKLQDDSLTRFVDVDGSGGFSVGDIVYGIVTMSEVLASGRPSVPVGASSQVAIVFSAMIAGAGPGGSLSLSPIGDSTDLLDLRNLLSASAQSGLTDASVAVVLSTTTSDAIPANDPLNWTPGQITTDFTNANNWFWEATLGLVGSSNFFQFLGSLALGGTERGAFTITSQAFGLAAWLPVDVLDFGVTKYLADATLDVGSVNIASGDQLAKGWTFRDQSSFFVNPVPEPGTVGLLGLALAALGFMRRRRKQ